MLSNLIKSNYIYFSGTEKRVIDSNNREDIYKFNPVTNVDVESGDEEAKTFVEGINAKNVEITPEINTDEMVDEILANANEKAEQIINDGISKANLEKEKIFEGARNEGYSIGKKEGQDEIARLKTELEEKAVSLEKDYNEKIKEVEPAFVKLMIDYLYKLTGVMAEDHKEIIHYLIHQSITGTENSKNYTIKVSKDDYPVVESKREEIANILKNDAQLEIIEDNSLSSNECFIETDNRMIDCSLNIKLENLITDLKILAHI